MGSKKVKWLVYTVLVGLLPFIIRFLIFLIIKNVNYTFLLNASDFVAFGLVLHISNINELEYINDDKNWKTVQNGVSAVFIVVYGVLFAATLIAGLNPGIFELQVMNYAAMIVSLGSFALSYSIYDRLSKRSKEHKP